MAHEISNSNGINEAAYAITPAWHGLGQVLDHAMTSREAINAAHLEWEVTQAPVYAEVMQGTGDDAVPVSIAIEGYRANMRSDTNKVLGVVSDKYKPVQNVDAFAFTDALVKDGTILYESAGALRGGELVWILARMPKEHEVAKGDAQRQYFLFLNGHNGKRRLTILPTNVRVVCMNTVRLALQEADKMLQFSHTGDITGKIELARQTIGILGEKFTEHYTKARALCGVQVKADRLAEYVATVFPAAEGEEVSKQLAKTRNRVVELFDDPTNRIQSMKGSAWAAVNAVTHYIDHEKTARGGDAGEKMERRFINSLLDVGADVKTAAFDTAVAMFVK